MCKIAPGCNRYVQANSTVVSCWKIAIDGGISQALLFEINTVLGELASRASAAIRKYGLATSEGPTTTAPPATTSVPTSEPTAFPTPLPIHEGTTPNCNKWAEAQDGDYFWKMANDAGIELSSFYEWNTVLANGDSCDMIWPGYFYCIGVRSDLHTPTTQAPPTSTTATAPKPSQTQAGIPASCNKFSQALSGASSWQLATDSGITLEQFYSWNPVVGSAGENCGTQIWPEYYYYVGISG
ncbi:LysM domain-containing protein [Colletotrichum sp. SAR 10_77]|nr:LysM domain-containing protein [Colletotrichum sp. SAR 10_77]